MLGASRYFAAKFCCFSLLEHRYFSWFCSTGVHGDADLRQNSEVGIRDTEVPVLRVQMDDVAVPMELGTCIVGNVETAPAPKTSGNVTVQ